MKLFRYARLLVPLRRSVARVSRGEARTPRPAHSLGSMFMLLVGGVFSVSAHAAFDTKIASAVSASISSNIPGESHFDDHRFNLPDVSTTGVGGRANWSASATGDYNFPDQYATRCVRNDGTTPCNGKEGPGESGLLYTIPTSYIRRSGGQSFARTSAVADNGVLRVTAIADNGGPVLISAPIPGNEERLYSRHVDNKGASAQVTADLHTSNTVLGTGGGVGQVTLIGHIDGGISGNGGRPIDLDPTNILAASRAGAIFSLSVTSWRPGNVCGTFGCPAQNFLAKFGSENSETENGNFVIPFSLTVDVVSGFKLETFMRLSAYAYGQSTASFGSTARIDSIEVSDGFSLDTSDGTLARVGNLYSFVPTLAPVPEPSSWMMFLGGLMLICVRRRRANSFGAESI